MKMDRYLVETPHTAQDCKMLIDQIYAMGYLYHFDWGCMDGVHCGWAIVEAESEADARLSVPPMVRNKARVIKLYKFDGDPKIVHQMHEQRNQSQ
jgi:hypothetical protein